MFMWNFENFSTKNDKVCVACGEITSSSTFRFVHVKFPILSIFIKKMKHTNLPHLSKLNRCSNKTERILCKIWRTWIYMHLAIFQYTVQVWHNIFQNVSRFLTLCCHMCRRVKIGICTCFSDISICYSTPGNCETNQTNCNF